MENEKNQKGKLILEDGTVFEGKVFGYPASSAGEVVFTTGMVGYPESMTDPSFMGQILVFTYPLIGNYGVHKKVKDENGLETHFESDNIQVNAVLVSEYCEEHSHWDSRASLDQWMKDEKIPGLYGIDTRYLTQKIREKGVMLGKIIVDKDLDYYDPNKENLVEKASVKEPILYKRGKKKVVLIDCGAKHNIIRSLIKRDITVLRVPWDYDVSKEDYDGLVISNGPGDPKYCDKTISNIRKAFQKNKPIFGICMGNQLISLAAGADTFKLKYGHRSQNQPCVEKGTKHCYITSQNHGFAVAENSIPSDWEPWFVNVNDNTNEGIRHKTKPFFTVQFHPEATPGPVDTDFLFDRFVKIL